MGSVKFKRGDIVQDECGVVLGEVVEFVKYPVKGVHAFISTGTEQIRVHIKRLRLANVLDQLAWAARD